MKIPILLMNGLLLGLAATSAYLWTQLDVERGRARQLADQLVTLRADTEKLHDKRRVLASAASSAVSGARPSAAAPATPASSASTPANTDEHTSKAWGESRERLLQDRSTHALMRAERIADMRLREPELARRLGMSDAEYQALLELRVDQELRRQEAFAQSQSGQSAPFDFKGAKQREHDELAKLIGDERLRQYDAYQAAAPDRATVRSLRGRLGEADALSDEQATDLAAGFYEERTAMKKELDAQFGGHASYTMGTASGATFMASGTLAEEDAMEHQLTDEIQGFRKRMVSRASTILTPRQLEVFETMQDWDVASQLVRVRAARETPPPSVTPK